MDSWARAQVGVETYLPAHNRGLDDDEDCVCSPIARWPEDKIARVLASSIAKRGVKETPEHTDAFINRTSSFRKLSTLQPSRRRAPSQSRNVLHILTFRRHAGVNMPIFIHAEPAFPDLDHMVPGERNPPTAEHKGPGGEVPVDGSRSVPEREHSVTPSLLSGSMMSKSEGRRHACDLRCGVPVNGRREADDPSAAGGAIAI